MSFLFRYVWFSDVEIGVGPPAPVVYGEGEPLDTILHVNSLLPRPEFVVDTGDCAYEPSEEAQTIEYANIMDSLLMPLHVVPGNRDIGTGGHNFFLEHVQSTTCFAFDGPCGRLRFIGIETYNDDGIGVSDEIIDFLLQECENLGNKIGVLHGHYPLPGSGFGDEIPLEKGGSEVLELLNQYNFIAYFNGHRHAQDGSVVIDNITYINGTAVSYATGGGQTNLDGGFTVCDVFSDRIVLDYRRGRDPWDSFDEGTTPHYTTVIIPVTVYDSEEDVQRSVHPLLDPMESPVIHHCSYSISERVYTGFSEHPWID